MIRWAALLVGLVGCTALTPPPDDAAIVDESVVADVSVAAAPDLTYSPPGLLITGVVAGKDLRGNSVRLGDGEWNLAGVPPEGTFVAAVSDDTIRTLEVFFTSGVPVVLAANVYQFEVSVTAREGVFFVDGISRMAWWPALASPVRLGDYDWDQTEVSDDGRYIAFDERHADNSWTEQIGPREGPFESADNVSAIFAPSTGRVYLTACDGGGIPSVTSVDAGDSIRNAKGVCSNCTVCGASTSALVATVEPGVFPMSLQPEVVVRDADTAFSVRDHSKLPFSGTITGYGSYTCQFVDGRSELIYSWDEPAGGFRSIDAYGVRDYAGGVDLHWFADTGDLWIVNSIIASQSEPYQGLGCLADAELDALDGTQLAHYAHADFLALSDHGSWALSVGELSSASICYDDHVYAQLIVHTSSSERAVSNCVNPDTTGYGPLCQRYAAWIDDHRLLFVELNTLYLLDTSVDPWTVSPVADHVGQYIWNAATGRLFYAVRSAGTDDGIYVTLL